MAAAEFSTSPFFHAGPSASSNSLAILHLRRDQLIPTVLHEPHQGGSTIYEEGHVETTRFGAFPHSTLIGQPWGSQVLASQVDTGSKRGKKRKAAEISGKDEQTNANREANTSDKQAKAPVTASTGFCHLLPPTPETWTISLPHRTQVVYTPDYSFILQKLQVRPGSVIIEAGAGSGSFTHAAARAVFNGYPGSKGDTTHAKASPEGRVYSFEYHEPRAKQLQSEIASHGLSSMVRITHRDVYGDGFLIPPNNNDNLHTSPSESPLATAVFLDLPAPWLALPNLKRSSHSPLNPLTPVHLCCFLPCIEQAQRAISSLRAHGWLEIVMHELVHRRLDVRREKVGLAFEGLRGVNASPATVEEAVERLVEVEKQMRERIAKATASTNKAVDDNVSDEVNGTTNGIKDSNKSDSRAARLARIAEEQKSRKPWQDGRIIVRTENEIKTHTSYLVFAVLPVEWTAEMEEECRAKWPVKKTVVAHDDEKEEDGDDAGVGAGGQVSKKRQKGKRR